MKNILYLTLIFGLLGCSTLQDFEITEADYTYELKKLQDKYQSGSLSTKQYEQKRSDIVKSHSKWRSDLNSGNPIYIEGSF